MGCDLSGPRPPFQNGDLMGRGQHTIQPKSGSRQLFLDACRPHHLNLDRRDWKAQEFESWELCDRRAVAGRSTSLVCRPPGLIDKLDIASERAVAELVEPPISRRTTRFRRNTGRCWSVHDITSVEIDADTSH